MPWFPILLAVHIALAISLLLPSLLLPFLLRPRDPAGTRESGGLAALLLRAQGTATIVVGLGLAATGAGLLAILGPELLRKPWLLAALGIYAANLLVAAFVSRPNLRRLLRLQTASESSDQSGAVPDRDVWGRVARRQRLLAYAMALATGLIGFLMSTKPEF